MDKQEIVRGTIKQVEKFFSDQDWNYDFEEDRNLFRTGVNLNSKMKSTKIFISVGESGVTVTSVVPMNADEACRTQVMEFITRANYGLRNGNFELDLSDGEIRYKVFHSNVDGVASSDLIKHSIFLSCSMLDRYGDDLLAVMFGMKDPKTAVEEAEAKD